MKDGKENLLELLDIYMGLSDRQNDTIILLTKTVREQAFEIQQLKGTDESISYERDLNLSLADDAIHTHDNLN